jgi:hypothetical protein
MITSYLHNGIFQTKKVKDLNSIISDIHKNKDLIVDVPILALIEILDKLGKSFITNKKLRKIEGSNFLALWLKRKNLINMIDNNLNNIKYLDEFVEIKENQYIKAQPRGLVAHWIAGNVPTLGIFSLVQSILCKNLNILRIPEKSVDTVIPILKELNSIKIEHNNKKYNGSDIVKSLSVIYYPKDNIKANEMLSKNADAKLIWGGKESVKQIKNLPAKEHCEDIIFGPKYSFGVFDKEFLESEDITKELSRAVMDIIVFDQSACSSPQVLFFEKNNKYNIKQIADLIKKEFNTTAKRYPKNNQDYDTAARIINARGEYLLDENKDIVLAKALDWTVLINRDICLEEPIQSRTIFIKEINSINDIVPLITKKIQTVGIAIKNLEKTKVFCSRVTYRGVARCVKFGSMNNYESPWDGMLALSRLVRFVKIKR